MIRIANAPCSWGTLEFEGLEGEQIGYGRMLDELAQTGYAGTELGDWGYMPTDPAALRDEMKRRRLALLGAFVPVPLRDERAHGTGEEVALRVASLLSAASDGTHHPFVVLADANGTDPLRTQKAGRVTPELMLSDGEWHTFAMGCNGIAAAVRDETGLRTVFHHHCAGFVETPGEIERLLDLTDPDLMGLVFDTGHWVYGSGKETVDLPAVMTRWKDRIWYVHFKDCDPLIARRAREEGWDYFTALKHGVFCELGQGIVDFPAVVGWLREHRYDGWIVVEQDVLPGMGAPVESALRNREYLLTLGL